MATRWACVGVGKIAADFFTALQDNLPPSEHQCVAVASRDLSRAQQFAEKFRFQKAYGSYDEVANDKDVDVVYISTYHTSHVELSLKMLEAGKHVVCEKPMAMNTKQAKMVIELAQSKKLFFLEAIWSRFFPVYEKIREELAAGSLGDIRLVMASFTKKGQLRPPNEGGGALLVIGIYPVQLACLVYKEMPESITAVGNLADNGADESACIILKYKNGAMANLTYHLGVNGDNNASIQGTNGKIEIEGPHHCPTRVTTPSGTFEYPLKEANYTYGNSAGLHYEAAATRKHINSGVTESDLYSHADSIMVSTIMDEIRRQIGMVYPHFDSC